MIYERKIDGMWQVFAKYLILSKLEIYVMVNYHTMILGIFKVTAIVPQ